jgi:hypothetical protein
MTDPITVPCQCEHADHFDGGPCHSYGQEHDIEETTASYTLYGTFTVCVECRTKHLPDELLRG